jgi:hypothetical protein
MKQHRYSQMKVVGLSLLSSLALFSVFSACSTSGGKQEPLIEHHATNETFQGRVSQVNDRVQSAFNDLGIRTTSSQTSDSGKSQEITGKNGDKTITVDMKEAGKGTTEVEVVAREGSLQWNEDYAETVLSKISEKS